MRLEEYLLQEVSRFVFKDPKFSQISSKMKVKYLEKALRKSTRKKNKVLSREIKQDLRTLRKLYGRSEK